MDFDMLAREVSNTRQINLLADDNIKPQEQICCIQLRQVYLLASAPDFRNSQVNYWIIRLLYHISKYKRI